MLNVEGERSRWSREFSRPRFKRVSNDLLEAWRLVRGCGGRQGQLGLGLKLGTGKRRLGQSSGNRLAILPAFVGKERVTKFWKARVTSTCPQFVSRAKREWEIFICFLQRQKRVKRESGVAGAYYRNRKWEANDFQKVQGVLRGPLCSNDDWRRRQQRRQASLKCGLICIFVEGQGIYLNREILNISHYLCLLHHIKSHKCTDWKTRPPSILHWNKYTRDTNMR